MSAARRITLSGCLLALGSWGCDVEVEHTGANEVKVHFKSPSQSGITLPKADQRLCTAVAILLDTSGSMHQSVRDRDGKQRPKEEIARDALARIIDVAETWTKAHPDRQLEMGIFPFSSDVSTLVPMGPFDAQKARAELSRVHASSGTAIGRALERGFKELYAKGCVRKHILCITDGENTSGPSPEQVSRAYFEATQSEVTIHFVAFDTAAKKFRFLEQVNGSVVEAADAEQLQTQLTEIYEKQILAEAMPAEKQ
jgi:Mg-chelatase subunit ChlD